MKTLFVCLVLSLSLIQNASAQVHSITEKLPSFWCGYGPYPSMKGPVRFLFKLKDLQVTALVKTATTIADGVMTADAVGVGGTGKAYIEVKIGSYFRGTNERVNIEMKRLDDMFDPEDTDRMNQAMAKEGVTQEVLDQAAMVRSLEFDTWLPFYEILDSKGKVLFRFTLTEIDGPTLGMHRCR